MGLGPKPSQTLETDRSRIRDELCEILKIMIVSGATAAFITVRAVYL